MEDHLKEIIAKQAKTITLMFVIILILIALLFLSRCEQTQGLLGVETPPAGCGNSSDTDQSILANGPGAKLFKQNCAVCHSTTDQKIVGPGLRGIYERVPQPAEPWLKRYILNSEKVLSSGDPYANKIHKENGNLFMTEFEGELSDAQLAELLTFLNTLR